MDLKVVERKLENGIPVLMVPMRGTKFFTHIAMARAGSRYENAERNGMSHLLEHMMFKGTKKRKTAQDIASELSDLGAKHNAFTGSEFVGFYVDAMIEHFAQASDIMSDQLVNAIMRESELEKEKDVVFQEMARSESKPTDVMFDMILPMLYGDQAAGRNIIGTRETVGAVTPGKLRYWHKKYFNRGNMVIVVAGKLPPEDETLDILNEDYADVVEGEPPVRHQFREDERGENLSVEYRNIPQSSFVLTARSVPFGSPQVPALDVLTTVLGGDMSSRLFKEVREERGLAYSVSAGSQEASDTGFTFIYAGTEPSKVPEAVKVIRREVANLLECGISDEELEKAKSIIRSDFYRTCESRSSIASGLAREYLHLGHYLTPEEDINRLDEVTSGEVLKLVPKIFNKSNLHLAVVGPHKGSMKNVL